MFQSERKPTPQTGRMRHASYLGKQAVAHLAFARRHNPCHFETLSLSGVTHIQTFEWMRYFIGAAAG
jgi:hypothetical protein